MGSWLGWQNESVVAYVSRAPLRITTSHVMMKKSRTTVTWKEVAAFGPWQQPTQLVTDCTVQYCTSMLDGKEDRAVKRPLTRLIFLTYAV